MARFASPNDKAQWKADKGPWAFLSDRSGFFDKHVDERESWDNLSDVARLINETIIKNRYLVVVWPEKEAENHVPVFNEGDKSFTAGFFTGFLFIADVVDGKVECQGRLVVESSDVVKSRTGGRGVGRIFNKEPKQAIKDDFENNFEKAMKAIVPEQVDFGTMGSLF
jgi:hypothetical protein